MYLPKSDIFSALNRLRTLDYAVKQSNQNSFDNLPTVTFRVSTNDITLNLDNEISKQEIEIIVDVWSEDSMTASSVLNDVERIMRDMDYRLSFSSDIPDPEGLFHISNRFKSIK